jgi:hypothetical protein
MGPDTEGVLARLYDKIKSLQPGCLVLLNQGFVDGSAVRALAPTYAHREYDLPPVPLWPKDINNGEVTPPPPAGHDPMISVRGKAYYLPMETCDTLAHHWFWEPGDALKSVRTLVRLYRSTVDKGASLLLDLAPDKTGRIPEATAKRLMEMKAAWPIRPDQALAPWGVATASTSIETRRTASPGAVDDDSIPAGDRRRRERVLARGRSRPSAVRQRLPQRGLGPGAVVRSNPAMTRSRRRSTGARRRTAGWPPVPASQGRYVRSILKRRAARQSGTSSLRRKCEPLPFEDKKLRGQI